MTINAATLTTTLAMVSPSPRPSPSSPSTNAKCAMQRHVIRLAQLRHPPVLTLIQQPAISLAPGSRQVVR
ncbi:hypothetical protein Hypma_014241 [Hypsizygus marmoreus]|uniref:Uncharacterized protein n=1 Tax=Hypsizygus marmoreus TaxID=39966 RepID=A0A369JEW1_HYPMA|nr:hypothetical protein Hypma_014241 [Hypsizygus marmoreus]